MLDLDGVVYLGEQVVDGVPDVLEKARGAGMKLAFVTNNASRTPDQVADQLTGLGVPAAASDVVTSAQAAASEVASRVDDGAAVLVVGGEGLEVALRERGLRPVSTADEQPAAVVQGFAPTIGWSLLAEGVYAVRAGALWVASNLDLTVPTARGIAPGNGTLVRAVAAALGREPDVVAGKPHRPLFDETVQRVSCSKPLVVGDRLDTDIAGAVTCGADSLLVLTGITDAAALCHATPEQRPSYVAGDLTGLLRPHQAPERQSDGGWGAAGWLARVESGRLSVESEGDDGDVGLATVATVCWEWTDAASGDDSGSAEGRPADLDLSVVDRLWPRG